MIRSRILTLCLFGFISIPAAAQPLQNSDVDDFFHYLGQLNRYSPVEGAGSHGSFGTNLGVGLSAAEWKTATVLHETAFDQEALEDEQVQYIPKVFLVRGTPWPLDLGLTLGKLETVNAIQASGHAQWTVFEGFALPAIAVRASYATMLGLVDTSFTSSMIDGVVSYGFLRIFTLYASLGVQRNDGSVRVEATNAAISLRSGQDSGDLDLTSRYTTTTQSAGLRLTFLPPFFSAAGEYQRSATGYQSYAAKLNMLL